MKIKTTTLLTAALLAVTIPVSAATSPPSVAIFDFESKEESVKNLGANVAALLNAYLSADPNLILGRR